jgi:biotin transport system substrate-specific component
MSTHALAGSLCTLLSTIAARSARVGIDPLVRGLAVLGLALLTAAAAQVGTPIPGTPVPLTLQPLVVLLGGAALGARLGASSQVLYLTLGIAGLPVFAAVPGLPQGALRLLGPTGGFLLAFPAAAFLAGALAERGWDRRWFTAAIAMLAGLAAIYAGGIAGLMAMAGLTFAEALAGGAGLFLAADAIKVAVAAALLPAAWFLLGRRA